VTGDYVTIYEVGPRDGLQSLQQHIPTSSKVALIDALSETGLRKIETTSFVHPKWVPQLADGADVMAQIARNSEIVYCGLVPNLKGVAGALEAGCSEVAVFISASEGFSAANINCSIEDSVARIEPVIRYALDRNCPVRAYLSCVISCPFDGPTQPSVVASLSERLLRFGCYKVSLGDTIGSATPDSTKSLLDEVLQNVPVANIAGHFHDTNGAALSNIRASLELGVRTFDSSIAGLGGCPYAPGASGNVDTRAVIDLLRGEGFKVGINLDALKRAEDIAHEMVRT